MGKEGKERTKRNVKTSSSARAAQLLAQQGGGFVGFQTLGHGGGLGLMTGSGGAVASFGASESDTLLTPELRVCLAKLRKKDATTKIKSLQELAAELGKCDESCIPAVLNHWPRLYQRLCLDSERRVRDSAQLAFLELAKRAGRQLGPHLRAIMGSWLMSQHDVSNDAAARAKLAFSTVFPPDKRVKTLLHCHEAVLAFLTENLVSHSAQTLSDASGCGDDTVQAEARFERVVMASLLAFSDLVSSLDSKSLEASAGAYEAVLGSSKFWKHAKSKSPLIRSALYDVAALVSKQQPAFLADQLKRAASFVLGGCQETDAGLLRSAINAILHFTLHMPESWTTISFRKAALPRLWELLKAGGRSQPDLVYESLLPLLRHLPQEVFGEGAMFVDVALSSLLSGAASLKRNPRGMASLGKAYKEMVLYFFFDSGLAEREPELRPFLLKHLFEALARCGADLRHLPPMQVALVVAEVAVRSLSQPPIKAAFWAQAETACLEACAAGSIPATRAPDADLDSADGADESRGAVQFQAPSKQGQEARSNGPAPQLASLRVLITTLFAEDALVADLVPLCGRICARSFELAQQGGLAQAELLAWLLQHHAKHGVLDHFLPGTPQAELVTGHLLPWLNTVTTKSPPIGPEIDAAMASVLSAIAYADGRKRAEHFDAALEACVMAICEGDWTAMAALLDVAPRLLPASVLAACLTQQQMEDLGALLCDTLQHPIEGQAMEDSLSALLRVKDGLSWIPADALKAAVASVADTLATYRRNVDLHFFQSDEAGEIDRSRIRTLLRITKGASQAPVPAMCPLLVELFRLQFPLERACVAGATEKTDIKVMAAGAWKQTLGHLKAVPDLANSLRLSLGTELRNTLHGLATGAESKAARTTELERLVKQATVLVDTACAGEAEQQGLLDALLPTHAMLCEARQDWPWSEQFTSRSFVAGDLTLLDQAEVAELEGETVGGSESTPAAAPLLVHFVWGLLLGLGKAVLGASRLDDGVCRPWLLAELAIAEAYEALTTTDGLQPLHRYSSDCMEAVTEGEKGPQAVQLFQRTVRLLVDDKSYVEAAAERDNRPLRIEGLKLLLNRLTRLPAWTAALQDPLPFLLDLTQELLDSPSPTAANHLEICFRALGPALLGKDWVLAVAQRLLDALQADHPSATAAGACILAPLVACMSEICLAALRAPAPALDEKLAPAAKRAMERAAAVEATLGRCSDRHWKFLAAILGVLVAWEDDNANALSLEADEDADDGDNADEDDGSDAGAHLPAWLVGVNSLAAKVFTVAVEVGMGRLSPEHWDTILCAAIAWLEVPTQRNAEAAVCARAATLLGAASKRLAKLKVQLNTESSNLPASLTKVVHEWEEFFMGVASGRVLSLFLEQGDLFSQRQLRFSLAAEFVGALAKASPCILDEALVTCDVERIARLVAVSHPVLQRTACMLSLKALPLQRAKSDNQLFSSEEIKSRTEPTLQRLQGHMHAKDAPVLWSDVLKILLNWLVFVGCFKGAQPQDKAELAAFLRAEGILTGVMALMFDCIGENAKGQLVERAVSPGFDLLELDNLVFGSDVEHGSLLNAGQDAVPLASLELLVATHVFYQTVQAMPSLLRQWWEDSCPRKLSGRIGDFAAKYISPHVIRQELEAIATSSKTFENMVVKVRPAASEVAAVYEYDSMTMELVVALPPNYPLKQVDVACGQRVGVPAAQWRQWLLQMTVFIANQNGAILDALAIWKQNVDKKFEGIEDCPICYSVIHGSNYQLPTQKCKTCKHLFHSACLFKWFSTSNQSTCPLCRNLF